MVNRRLLTTILFALLFTFFFGFKGTIILFVTRCFFKWGNDLFDLLVILITGLIASGYIFNALIY